MNHNSEQLKKYLDSVNQIFYKIIQSFEFCEYLYTPVSEKYSDLILNVGFFRFSSYALFRICFVDLHKLLSKNKKTNKFNLHQLIDRLSINGIYYNEKITQKSIENF